MYRARVKGSTMFVKPTLWALLVVTALELSYGNPCENGPSGRFCSKADLSGWYECKEEEGEMVQTEHKCSEGTRYDILSILLEKFDSLILPFALFAKLNNREFIAHEPPVFL